MDHREVERIWDENTATWTRPARMGCDILRDWVNTPAFLEMLPDVAGLRGLDIGCGEGHNTRLVAGRAAKMTAFDISRAFVQQARAYERRRPGASARAGRFAGDRLHPHRAVQKTVNSDDRGFRDARTTSLPRLQCPT